MFLRNKGCQLTCTIGALFVQLFNSLVGTLYTKFQEFPPSLPGDLVTFFALYRRVELETLGEDFSSFLLISSRFTCAKIAKDVERKSLNVVKQKEHLTFNHTLTNLQRHKPEALSTKLLAVIVILLITEKRTGPCKLVCDSNSKVAQHANEFNHNVKFDQATIVDRVTDYNKRLFLRHGIL